MRGVQRRVRRSDAHRHLKPHRPSPARLDSYSRWLADEDLSAYERYRYVLEALDRDDGRRWVLKAPAHTAELRHLVDAFPGAVVVHLHRDIVDTIASGASLFATFRSTYSDDVRSATSDASRRTRPSCG